MNKNIIIYILMIISIALLSVLMNIHWEHASIIKFPRELHIIIEGTNTLLMFLIFLIANHFYSTTKDQRLVILAGGFLIGAIFNCVHIITITTFPYDLLSIANLHKNPTLVYLLFSNLILPFSIYFAIIHKPLPSITAGDFRLKTYSLYFFVFLALTLSPLLIHNILPRLTYNIEILMHAFEFINYSLYIMLAFMIINIRQASNLTFFPIFTTGLVVLGLGGLFYINPLLIPVNEILAHFFQATGLIFILAGLWHFQTYAKFLRFKDELAAYLCLMLIAIYITFISFVSWFFHTIFPPVSAFIFVEFLLVFQFIIYLLANKLTQPITNLIDALGKYTPGERPINVPVIRHDEIGTLTEKINTLSEISYQKILEVSELAEREQSIIRVFETMRRISNPNVIKNTIIDEIKKAFNSDRCFIVLYDSAERSFYYDRYVENLPSKTLKNYDVNDEVLKFKHFIDVFENNIEICFSNLEEYIEKNSLHGTEREYLLREYNIKSRCHIPINYSDKLLGYIILEYTKDYIEFSKEDLAFLNTMAAQIGITIHESGSNPPKGLD